MHNHLLYYREKDPMKVEERAALFIGESLNIGRVLDIVQIVPARQGFFFLLKIEDNPLFLSKGEV